MTAREAVELCGLIGPRTAIPIHYEGWRHFREGADAIERELATAPEDIRKRIRWLALGDQTELVV
jgi:L-ascorbate metabolism protein UlaG (beta-lactamase superfamily)